jgi:hypothetical protein
MTTNPHNRIGQIHFFNRVITPSMVTLQFFKLVHGYRIASATLQGRKVRHDYCLLLCGTKERTDMLKIIV